MYTFFRSVPSSQLVRKQLPALLAAFLVAEAFYKLQSFTLECLAFLATWFVFDALVSGVSRLILASGKNGKTRVLGGLSPLPDSPERPNPRRNGRAA